jgi:hypothetical protein
MNHSGESVPAVLQELEGLDREGLARRWTAAFGCPAPHHSHAPFLRSALAWHCQMHQLGKGGTKPIERLLRGLRRAARAESVGPRLAPGTRLLREWQGQTHHVTVLVDRFDYKGRTYRSLTAIAREITGTAWSGPLFFGLRA